MPVQVVPVVLERVVLLPEQTAVQAKQHILHKTLAEAAVELLVKMELDYQVLMQRLVLTVMVVVEIMVLVVQGV